jgi:hypothetical protein
VTFLGFVFKAAGTNIDSQRFQKIRSIRAPKNITETRQICGLFQYFKRHVPNFAKILSAIRQLLQKDVPFCWTAEHDQAIETLKELLLQNATLAYSDFQKEFVILVDVSRDTVGHVLAQFQNGLLRPLIFGGRSLRKFERRLQSIAIRTENGIIQKSKVSLSLAAVQDANVSMHLMQRTDILRVPSPTGYHPRTLNPVLLEAGIYIHTSPC